MPDPDFRALCVELVDIVTAHCNPDNSAVGYCAAVLTRARAALSQPEPEGPTDEEMEEAPFLYAPEWYNNDMAAAWEAGRNSGWCDALARFARPALKPVPVTERPWEREGWCDAAGRCWWGRPSEELCNSDWFLATRAEVEEFCDCSPPVVSLPHHALPVPTPANKET